MYIRIEFENVGSTKTNETQYLFSSSPNGMFLTSSKAYKLQSKEMKDAVGDSVMFWYLDIDILNKHYYGVMNCLNDLVRYPGVSHVDVLPIEGRITDYNEACATLMKYIHGVK